MIKAYSRVLCMAVPLATLAACTDDPPSAAATATIENKLPVDGCSYPVTIDGVQYAPDAASLSLIQDHHIGASATANVHYRLTGNTGHIECGRTQPELPEISLTFD